MKHCLTNISYFSHGNSSLNFPKIWTVLHIPWFDDEYKYEDTHHQISFTNMVEFYAIIINTSISLDVRQNGFIYYNGTISKSHYETIFCF